MATVAEVQAFMAGRYRRPAPLDAKIADLVHPSPIRSESDILAGLLARKFDSSISGAFIRKAGQTVEAVCKETLARSSRAGRLLARELRAFTAGRATGGESFAAVAADPAAAREWRDDLAKALGVSKARIPLPDQGETAAVYHRRIVEALG